MRFFSRRKEIFVLILVVALFVLNIFGKNTRSFLYSLSEPIQRTFFEAGRMVSNWADIILRIKELKTENEAFQRQVQELESRIAFLKETEKENQALRQALELDLQEDFKLLLADIISKDLSGDAILINKGAKDGILKGQVVITPQKALVGKIEEVYDTCSRVILISNQGFSFPGKIQAEDLIGIIKGGGNFMLFFDLIPQDVEVEKGQEVVTVSLENTFPKGIFVGEIEFVEKSDLVPFQKARVKPAFNLKDLESLLVILNY